MSQETKSTKEEYIKQLEHKLAIYKARDDGEPEPSRVGPDCVGCGEKTEIRRDSRVSYCVNTKCKVGKQNV